MPAEHRHERTHACKDEFVLPGAEHHYPPDLELEPIHLDIALHLDLAAQTASGTVTHTIQCNRPGARTLRLHAAGFQDLTVDGQGFDLMYDYDGEVLKVSWVQGFSAGEQRPLGIGYRVTAPAAGLSFSRPDEHYPDAPWLAVTDHETERARHWLPTVDLPAVRPTLAFHLRAQQAYTIVANGAHLRDELHADGTKTSHWQLDQRCPSYLTCFIVGDFVRFDDGEHDGKPIAYFAPKPITPEMLRLSFGRTGAMLRWIEGKLDSKLPWPKYYQFAARGIGGAMENISLVSWDDRWVLDPPLSDELGPLIDAVNVHEMAHSWFGNLVVVRDYAHAWLKESWATYMEVCWLEDSAGRESQLYDLFDCAQAYIKEADSRYKRPIVTRQFNSSWNMYDRHLYPGGAYRLHMLRCMLGDEVFWTGVQLYVRRFAGQTVETADFRKVMEEVSGRSLVKWFEQWLYSKGYPDLEVKFSWDSERQEGTFDITQRQVKDDGDEPCFDFELTLGWVVDGERTQRQVPIRDRRAMFTYAMGKSPERVQVNPDGKVLCKLDFDPGSARLRAQLADPEDLLGRVHAAWTLAKTGKSEDVVTLRDAYRAEPFWGVRVELARALGEAGTEAAVAALASLLETHEEPRSLPALITAAGRYRDSRITAVLEARLDAGLRPKAMEAAHLALGAQRDLAPFPRLVRASEEEGIAGAAQSGALLGLAATRRLEALDVLQERVRYGAIEPRARPAGAQAIGSLAHGFEPGPRERAIDALRDLLRDPDRAARHGAALGLQNAAAAEAIPDLLAYRKTLPAQEQVEIDRMVHGLRRNPREPAKPADEALDDLRERLRKLEQRLTKLEAKQDPGTE